MIRQAGDAIRWYRGARDKELPSVAGLASANLAYQFGWEPLISDMWKLLTFQESYEKKRKELMRLYSGSGLRRNINLETLTDTFSESGNFQGGFGTAFNFSGVRTRTTKIWGSIRWKPTVVPPGGVPTDLAVYRAALGLDITLASVWEAIPWSWLVDWFTSAGDFLAAHRNTVPAHFSNICIMRKSECVGRFTSTSNPNGRSWRGATAAFLKEERTPYADLIYPTAYLPFLGNGQLSILGSLAILRGKTNGIR